MENLKDRLTRVEEDMARAKEEIAHRRRELQKEEARGEEYASTEDSVGSATRKRKIQPPTVQSRSIHTCTAPPPKPSKRSRIDDSSLMIDDNLRCFQSGGANFPQLLRKKGQAYFDRTRYIQVLTELNQHLLFFRPRRFGKSLTVGMLDHFHGLQYTEEHQSFYEGLDVQKDMAEGKVKPGQYFILKFDFSTVERSADAARYLKMSISQTFKEFYNAYATYLGEDAKTLIDPDSPALSLIRCAERVNSAIQKSGDESLTDIQGIYLLVDEYDAFGNDYLEPHRPTWEGTSVEATFRSFWATVKSLLWNGIQRSFITGISPLPLTDIGSIVARNISFDDDVAGLCGLTHSDIQAALKTVCGPNSESYQEHLLFMTEHFNGYHFCDYRSVETLYNTETCLNYLQCIIERKMPRIQDPPNSEVSDQFLKRFAASEVAGAEFQAALTYNEEGNFNLLKYRDLKQNFILRDLGKDIDTSQSAWRSLMIYFGGLTFYSKDPANYLKIPNKIAAKRIAEAFLQRYGLSGSLSAALDFLRSNGDIQPVLSCYRDLMVQRDVGLSDFKKSDEIHRDSFCFSLLHNHSLLPRPEFKVIKANKAPGLVALLLQLQRYLIVIEWKVVQIDSLDMQVPGHQYPNQDTKASALGEYTLSQILQLKFGHWDRFRPGQALKQWTEQIVAPQLKGYIRSDQVMQLVKDRSLVMRAHLVVVVGSRHILLWDMDSDGKLISCPNLI